MAFTTGDVHDYIAPAWLSAASKSGGVWQNDAFQVPTTDPADSGALIMEVDRALLTTNAVLEISLADTAGATLYLDLLDNTDTVVAADLEGNLINGTDTDVSITVTIPLATYSTASKTMLRRGVGDVTVYDCLLYVDQDGDGLDAEQETQLGTLDTSTDTDADGISDPQEVLNDMDPTLAPGDTAGVERLVQYMVRCPFSLDRIISRSDDGKIVYRAEKATKNSRQNTKSLWPRRASANARSTPPPEQLEFESVDIDEFLMAL